MPVCPTPHGLPVERMKRILFWALALSIPILFFVALELGLRWGDYRNNTDLFIYPEEIPEYGLPNPNFASRYFFNTTVVPTPNADLFLKRKPEGGLRIVVMGESSAAGYPYPNNGGFARVVRDALQDVMPGTPVEIVNVAMSAINTYTLYDQIDEILEIGPDAVLIYTGHNEYYGALGVGSSENLGAFPGFVRFYLGIQRLKTFMLLRDGMSRASRWIASIGADETDGYQTLMQQVVAEQIIPLGSPLFELGRIQFESNLTAILERYREAGVPVFIGSLASNLRDHTPFEGEQALAAYRQAKAFDQAGQTDSARAAYLRAKDLDALRFRAPESFNPLIRNLAETHGAHYVPVREAFDAAARDSIIGFDLMLEHLHPNADGYHLMGMTFVQAIREQGALGRTADWSRLRPARVYRHRMALTELDERIVHHRMLILTNNWPFVKTGRPFQYGRYEFTSAADSIAFEVVNRDLSWEPAKVAMGEWYRSRRRYQEALAEFEGLMRDQPFNASPFAFGARTLLEAGYMEEARPYLNEAHRLEPSAYTYKMLGALEVNADRPDTGVPLLEQSVKLNADDAQTWYNLSGGYAKQRRFDQALEAARTAARLNPNFPGLQAWIRQLESLR